MPFLDDRKPYGSSSRGAPNVIAVRVHSPRGGAAAEPNTVLRNSYRMKCKGSGFDCESPCIREKLIDEQRID